jgi:hypothetical protein
MKKNYNEDDLLNYIYKELNPDENKLIEEEINQNPALKSLYLELLDGIELLNKTYLRPSEEVLSSIMEKAKENLKQNID